MTDAEERLSYVKDLNEINAKIEECRNYLEGMKAVVKRSEKELEAMEEVRDLYVMIIKMI